MIDACTANEGTMPWPRTVLVQLTLGLIAVTHWPSPAAPADAVALSDAAVRESLPFDPEDEFVFLPVRVGGKNYPFVLDTERTTSLIDRCSRTWGRASNHAHHYRQRPEGGGPLQRARSSGGLLEAARAGPSAAPILRVCGSRPAAISAG